MQTNIKQPELSQLYVMRYKRYINQASWFLYDSLRCKKRIRIYRGENKRSVSVGVLYTCTYPLPFSKGKVNFSKRHLSLANYLFFMFTCLRSLPPPVPVYVFIFHLFYYLFFPSIPLFISYKKNLYQSILHK